MAEQPKQNSPIDQVVPGPQPYPPLSPITKIFASALYSGYAPIAPGSVGTLVGLLMYLIPGFEQAYILLPACAVVFVLGTLAAGRMERHYGHDPAAVTIDEVLGMWVSLLFLPKSPFVVAAAFLLFRALDVLKPWPARLFDRMQGGWSIMADDVVAGIYANLVIQAAARIL